MYADCVHRFVTPNMVDDGHDTSIDFASAWLQYWLVPLLNNPSFNDNRTLILLTFDETETYTINNRIYTLVLGNGLPAELKGQEDDTYYTHYSAISTVQANWGLKSLGRQDTNKCVPARAQSRLSLTLPQDRLERLLLRRLRHQLHQHERHRRRNPAHEPHDGVQRPAQRRAVRALHRAEHERAGRGRRARVRRARPQHELHERGGAAAGQPHRAGPRGARVRPRQCERERGRRARARPAGVQHRADGRRARDVVREHKERGRAGDDPQAVPLSEGVEDVVLCLGRLPVRPLPARRVAVDLVARPEAPDDGRLALLDERARGAFRELGEVVSEDAT